jgi:hypothetical protein
MTNAEQSLLTKLDGVIAYMDGYPETQSRRALIAREDIRILIRSYVVKTTHEVCEQWLRDNPDYMKQYKQT